MEKDNVYSMDNFKGGTIRFLPPEDFTRKPIIHYISIEEQALMKLRPFCGFNRVLTRSDLDTLVEHVGTVSDILLDCINDKTLQEFINK